MAKYRKRPIVIEATQIFEQCVIHTLEGDMIASPGDWIITGINGEEYPCKPEIFAKTYEKAEPERRFQLNRTADMTGVSGTGIVADGEVYHDGTVRLYWRGKWKTSGEYPCLQAIEEIHCHHGATVIEWVGEAPSPGIDENTLYPKVLLAGPES